MDQLEKLNLMINKEIIRNHGISDDEYKRILDILGREPNITELGIFSVMWSEHCSYKSSKNLLKFLPSGGPHVIQGPGENAGIVDIGDGLAIAFKIESHNHPSFIEPYQGAATGVGGILRDIFTMGARPIALLNSLRFGSIKHPKTKYLLNGVISGIADYGNCMGIPTVGGETYFHECYNGNILVNVCCLGILKKDRIFKGIASGYGNSVIYVGSKTGRDGIHGATMASQGFNEDSELKRPNVQVGDPFTEKLLLEACLELMKNDYIIGIQDMGAAGLTCSSVEMASRGDSGIKIDVSLVPLREKGMTPYEIMLSESQERMLIVAKKSYENSVREIFKKWDLDAVPIGHITDDGNITIKDNNKIVARIPIKGLTDDAPVYNRQTKERNCKDERIDIRSLDEPKDYNKILLKMISSPNLSSREDIYTQYDHMVRTNTLILPGSDSSVIRIKGTKKALALTVDCNSRYCHLDPFIGSKIAFAEASRNIICSGARPIAITDCLNFGDPEDPYVMWDFYRSIFGIREGSLLFNIPIISGNVSFYNETEGIPIYPTPVIGMVGIIDDVSYVREQFFKNEGDIIILMGENIEDIDGSEYLKILYDIDGNRPPDIDLNLELSLQNACLEAIRKGIILSAHDVSDGGLAIAIVESCSHIGARVELKDDIRMDALLFGESQSRIIVSIKDKDLADFEKIADKYSIPFNIIGTVGGNRVIINDRIDISIKDIKRKWMNRLKGVID